MGTHPIFESDFDCLTDLFIVKGRKRTFKIRFISKEIYDPERERKLF